MGNLTTQMQKALEEARSKVLAANGAKSTKAESPADLPLPSFFTSIKPKPKADHKAAILSDAPPCPNCGGRWIVETYGEEGSTYCYSCKAERPVSLAEWEAHRMKRIEERRRLIEQSRRRQSGDNRAYWIS